MKQLVLASQSPRRKELLEKCGIPFITDPADIDETRKAELDVPDQIQDVSVRKATAVLKRHPDGIIIGSDTAVVIHGKILGKPQDEEKAFSMLKELQGNTHQVVTGLCILSSHRKYQNVTVTDVTFATMSDEEIRKYIATGECMDKAGAYGIQGYGGRYITGIRGDFYSVMGLPLHLVYEEMKNYEFY